MVFSCYNALQRTYSGGDILCGSMLHNHGELRACSAVHLLLGSSSNIESIRSKANRGRLKQRRTRLQLRQKLQRKRLIHVHVNKIEHNKWTNCTSGIAHSKCVVKGCAGSCWKGVAAGTRGCNLLLLFANFGDTQLLSVWVCYQNYIPSHSYASDVISNCFCNAVVD